MSQETKKLTVLLHLCTSNNINIPNERNGLKNPHCLTELHVSSMRPVAALEFLSGILTGFDIYYVNSCIAAWIFLKKIERFTAIEGPSSGFFKLFFRKQRARNDAC